MKREQMIKDLIQNELEWLLENHTESNVQAVAEFFADGGFNDWTDKDLLNRHDAIYGEEV